MNRLFPQILVQLWTKGSGRFQSRSAMLRLTADDAVLIRLAELIYQLKPGTVVLVWEPGSSGINESDASFIHTVTEEN